MALNGLFLCWCAVKNLLALFLFLSLSLGRKSRNLYTPLVFSAPAWGDPVAISWRYLMLIKLEWLGYLTYDEKKLWRCRFHLISERHGQTDGRTDGRTDGQNSRWARIESWQQILPWSSVKEADAASHASHCWQHVRVPTRECTCGPRLWNSL